MLLQNLQPFGGAPYIHVCSICCCELQYRYYYLVLVCWIRLKNCTIFAHRAHNEDTLLQLLLRGIKRRRIWLAKIYKRDTQIHFLCIVSRTNLLLNACNLLLLLSCGFHILAHYHKNNLKRQKVHIHDVTISYLEEFYIQ